MELKSYQLTNGTITIDFLNYGGIVTRILTPDRNGKLGNVVLGFDKDTDYLTKNIPYFGALIGRYANRIAKGKFSLEEKDYHLAINNGPNSLHGGLKGFDKVFWQVSWIEEKKSASLKYFSKDMEEGYPGNLEVEVVYSLTGKNEFKIEYSAKTDKPTVINLTNHSYFNLSAVKGSTILDHELFIDADRYTAVDSTLIPTGELDLVDGTMDFRKAHRIGENIAKVAGGYDHNYVLNQKAEVSVRLTDPKSERVMEVKTSEPGVQFYSGNFLEPKHLALALEAQHFPDSPNHVQFPTTVLRPGETYSQTTVYKFSC